MTARIYFLVVIICSALAFSNIARAEEEQAVINGQLFAGTDNRPAPGLVISLAHHEHGRSASASSDEFGRFTLIGIPVDQEPYFIEVYWGQDLVYRDTIYVTKEDVLLPPIYL